MLSTLAGFSLSCMLSTVPFLMWITRSAIGVMALLCVMTTTEMCIRDRMFAKLLNLFCKNKVNPMVGAAGISAFPMSARVIQKMGQEADCTNHLLMHAVGANVAGQIASVLAGGMILNLVPQLLG